MSNISVYFGPKLQLSSKDPGKDVIQNCPRASICVLQPSVSFGSPRTASFLEVLRKMVESSYCSLVLTVSPSFKLAYQKPWHVGSKTNPVCSTVSQNHSCSQSVPLEKQYSQVRVYPKKDVATPERNKTRKTGLQLLSKQNDTSTDGFQI